MNDLAEMLANAKAQGYQQGYQQSRTDTIDEIYPMVRELGSSKRIDDICEKMEQLKNGK